MKKIFEAPIMNVNVFSAENIVTDSSVLDIKTAEDMLVEDGQVFANTQSVVEVNWTY